MRNPARVTSLRCKRWLQLEINPRLRRQPVRPVLQGRIRTQPKEHQGQSSALLPVFYFAIRSRVRIDVIYCRTVRYFRQRAVNTKPLKVARNRRPLVGGSKFSKCICVKNSAVRKFRLRSSSTPALQVGFVLLPCDVLSGNDNYQASNAVLFTGLSVI